MIPKLSDLNPRVSELEGKMVALNAARAVRVSETATIRERLQNSPSVGNKADNRVRRILGETVEPEAEPDTSRLAQLLSELTDINSAIGQTHASLRNEHDIASKMVCNSMLPEVTKKGKAYGNALVALHKANTEYNELIDSIENTGASVGSLNRVWLTALGSPCDMSGQYMYGLRDFVDAGLLAKADLPVAFR